MQLVNIALFIYSFLLMMSIYISTKQTKHTLMNDKIFKALVLLTLILLVVDILARFQGLGHWSYPIFTHVGNFMSYGMSHFIPSMWFIYIHYRIYSDTERAKSLYKYFWVIHVINWILLIASQFNGWYYSIDSQNIYSRGPLTLWTHIVNGMILFGSVSLLILKRHRIESGTMFAYILFSFIPAIGLLAQVALPGIGYIPNSIALSIVILYTFVQNNRVRYDHLTGIFNRRQIDYYLEDKILGAKKGKTFTAILIDLDDFKLINDTLGHSVGDEAIKKTAKLLSFVGGKTEFVARYGGDEFLIITSLYEVNRIEGIIQKIYEQFDKFNKTGPRYHLNLSHGYHIYNHHLNLTKDEFIDIVDRKMYLNKTAKKKLQ